MDSSDLSDGAVTLQEYLELKKALATSEAKVQQLMKVNSSLSEELRRLQREVRTTATGAGTPSSARTPCMMFLYLPLDPQAAGREPAAPAASWASTHTPAPHRPGRTHTHGAWR